MEKNNVSKYKFAHLLSSIGFVTGIAYSFYKKTGFWKGWGISIIFSIAGLSLGGGIDYIINSSNKKQEEEK
jgi:hypothetical protein